MEEGLPCTLSIIAPNTTQACHISTSSPIVIMSPAPLIGDTNGWGRVTEPKMEGFPGTVNAFFLPCKHFLA